jgi:hypothetical protein
VLVVLQKQHKVMVIAVVIPCLAPLLRQVEEVVVGLEMEWLAVPAVVVAVLLELVQQEILQIHHRLKEIAEETLLVDTAVAVVEQVAQQQM